MGCVADKPVPETKGLTICRPSPSNPFPVGPPKESSETPINYKLIEALKKRDIFLLKRAVQQYEVKPTELIGPADQAKTILHKLAENNFSEGMAYFLEELSSQKSHQISRMLNMKDIDGNTPLLLCCLSDAVETLEVLSRSEYVDIEAKNYAKKTALEIAIEMESPCVNVLTSLTSGTTPTTKATFKSSGEGSQQLRSLGEAFGGIHTDREEDGNLGGQNTRTSLECRSPVWSSKDLKEQVPSMFAPTSLSRLCQLFADLKAKETNFIDNDFPHETYYLEDEYSEGNLLRKYPELTWSRPTSFINSKAPVVFDNFELNTVANTPLSGCEIYSAFAAMAEFPQRLSKIFNTIDINKYGLYSVNFTVAGVPIEIFLDDYFPSTSESQLLYSRPTGNELWFSLLEKAFAKLNGGYYDLESVGIAEALETLTGMPVAQRALKDVEEDKLWAKLMDYDKRNYIVCAGEMRRHQNSNKNRIFTIVSIVEVNQYKLIKLRNHFDSFSWEGDFAHNSPVWTKEMKEEAGYSSADKTCFYMDLQEFMKEFEFLTICHYHDNWVHNRMNVTCKPNHPVYYELNVEDKEIETYISVHQKPSKFSDGENDYSISPVEIILAKDLDGTGLESIAFGEHDAFLGKPAVYIHESHKVKLQPGKYFIYIKVKWTDNKIHDCFLNVLSSLPVKLASFTPPLGFDFLEKVYLNSGMTSKEQFVLPNDCHFASGWSGSHLWMYVHNKSNKTLNFEITFQTMKNLKLGKKCRTSPNTLNFVVPPNQKMSAYAKRTGPATVSVGWTFKQSWV